MNEMTMTARARKSYWNTCTVNDSFHRQVGLHVGHRLCLNILESDLKNIAAANLQTFLKFYQTPNHTLHVAESCYG